jgi:mRNA interferase RelE/StbE
MKADYKIQFVLRAAKELKDCPTQQIRKIITQIDALSQNPRPANSKKLKGNTENIWRIRIGDYRVIYHISDTIKIITIRHNRHRKDAYRL